MKESRLGVITSVAVHACAIPLLVAASFTVPQKPVKVVEVDFALLNERLTAHCPPEPQRKATVKKGQSAKRGAPTRSPAKSPTRSVAPAEPAKENREAAPPKEQAEPAREPTTVTASDPAGETIIHGKAATYADASGSADTLEPHGGLPGGTEDGQGQGSGGGEGWGGGGGQGGDAIVECGRDYNYIRDAIMRNVLYPEEAMRLGIEGKVVLSFIVVENGRTDRIEVVSSSGSRLLDRSARQAVAVTRIGRRVPYRVIVRLPITYRLRGH